MSRCAFAALVVSVAGFAACSDDAISTIAPTSLPAGEICEADNRPELKLSFDPPNIVVAPGHERPVRLTVEPDICGKGEAFFVSGDTNVAEAPKTATFDLRHATYDFRVRGMATGKTTIKATMGSVDPNGKPYTVDLELPVDVRDPAPPICATGEVTTGTIGGGSPVLSATGTLAGTQFSVPPAAFARADEFSIPAFPASIACADDLVAQFPSANLTRLGPAVAFTAKAPLSMSKALRREVEVTMPINPAAFPTAARLRHLVVLYQGPRVKLPRPIPIASPRIEPSGAGYVLKFSTSWLGTYQAAMEETAGLHASRRRLTHRAVIGFSMGGGGAATFGLRHHDKFDVIAPLGGPSDWTWLLWYVRTYVLGGFCPVGKTCAPTAPNTYPLDEPYAHTMDFEHWFYQPGSGNGGGFERSEYVQIFEDLAFAMGNPNGSGSDPKLSHMAAGPPANDPWVVGDPTLGLPPGQDCTITVKPIGRDPNADRQAQIRDQCAAYRCQHLWSAPTGYYDDEYNPDGTLPVSTFCDGAQNGTSPYLDTWAPGGTKPVNFALFVDTNKNGVRDQGEPIIRNSEEPFDDCGPDALCDAQEPGYDAVNNPDPNQDDYEPILNPRGLEGNHRWDEGEAYRDYGLDGVANTATKNVVGDKGEGDGKFTMAEGLANFYANDGHNALSMRQTALPGGPLDDAALARLDILSDGGLRDLFNFSTVADHFTGQIAGRTGANKLPLRSVAFYNGFEHLPGEPPDINYFNAGALRWADIAEMPSVRYGDVDASAQLISDGDGQHVGTVAQLLARLQTAFFYVAKRWPDADRRQTEESRDKAATVTYDKSLHGAEMTAQLDCEIMGRCEHEFAGPRSGRTGPVAVSLPPGYAQVDNVARGQRYPVLYVLHGYGQDPRDLEAVAIFTNNFMNVAQRSYATRMPKFIIVYVDGRCRAPNGKPECLQGTFYMNSTRPDGPQIDTWFEEVMDFVDRRYRTMGPSEVDVSD